MTYQSYESVKPFTRSTRVHVIPRPRSNRFKHLLTAATLDTDDVDELCHAADEFESGLVSSQRWGGKAIALLFFQSSTRTRLGFEAATVALGAHAIGMENMSTSSRSNARVGESLEDC